MKEEYLHYVWKSKQFENKSLKLTDGRTVQVEDSGFHNHDSGPDFFNGSILLDGLKWSGNIEIHIRSSDWYRHGHQNDRSYDNVILHVVVEDDRKVMVGNRVLPALELKGLLDENHYNRFQTLMEGQRFIPCSSSLHTASEGIGQQMDVALFQRLERKSLELIGGNFDANSSDRKRLFAVSLAAGFGTKANRIPFQELVYRIPSKLLVGHSRVRMISLILGLSGLLDSLSGVNKASEVYSEWLFLKHKYNLEPMNSAGWKFGGVRPQNSPLIRMTQLACVLSEWNGKDLQGMSADEVIRYVRSLFKSIGNVCESDALKDIMPGYNRKSTVSTVFINLLLMNGIVPYLYYLKTVFGDFESGDVAFELLELIPPEKNGVIRKWTHLGLHAQNASQTQALLEQKSQFCATKRCISCLIGQEIIDRKEVFS